MLKFKHYPASASWPIKKNHPMTPLSAAATLIPSLFHLPSSAGLARLARSRCELRNTMKRLIAPILVGLALLLGYPAQAGISYQLDTVQAGPGDTVRVKGMLFNDTENALAWTPPANLVLQWRNEQGDVIRSLAYLETPAQQIKLPVNNFTAISWRAAVPNAVKGLQAISIEGESALLALDTSPLENSLVAGTPAIAPIVDAGAGTPGSGHDPVLPNGVVAQAGASPTQGPQPGATPTLATAPSAFDSFRNSISTYEPIYFDIGAKDGTNARFQLSFKYRLFTPDDSANPGFLDHLYLGYTQTALWDLEGESKPFIDTTYNPSLFWQKDKIWAEPQNAFYIGLAGGVEHKSNGKSGDDSRSLNDFFLEPKFNYRFDGGSTLTFSPRVKSYFSQRQNDDYADYAGHVDWKLRWAQDNGLVLTGLYQQGKKGRNAMQLEAAWPLKRTFLNMNGYVHLQYFRGYGETLLGYQHKSPGQVRLGLALVP